MKILGWLLIIGGGAALIRALRRRTGTGGGADVSALAAQRRQWLTGAIASLVVGVILVATVTVAAAHLRAVDLSGKDDWIFFPETGTFTWDGSTLAGTLESGVDAHAMFPVDWKNHAVEAAWDLTVLRLDTFGPRDRASIMIGLFDQTNAGIDDRDHVGGSGLQACFSDDVRLRSSDQNHLLRTSSSTEAGQRVYEAGKFKKHPKVKLELNKKYHCLLSYSSSSGLARLEVTGPDGRSIFAADNPRELDELENYTSSVSWFGVSNRGFKLFNKLRFGKDDAYVRPKAIFKIENMQYKQS